MENYPTYTLGGPVAHRFVHACGLIFCRQPLEVAGQSMMVVAVWREPDPASGQQSKNPPAYVMAANMLARGTEALLGCAVLCLDHLGINRPRVGTIQRVAGMLAELSVGQDGAAAPRFNI